MAKKCVLLALIQAINSYGWLDSQIEFGFMEAVVSMFTV
jgi:hypothetical protein